MVTRTNQRMVANVYARLRKMYKVKCKKCGYYRKETDNRFCPKCLDRYKDKIDNKEMSIFEIELIKIPYTFCKKCNQEIKIGDIFVANDHDSRYHQECFDKTFIAP